MTVREALLATCLALVMAGSAHAAQTAQVKAADGSKAHQYPSASSPVLETFTNGARVPISTDMVRDGDGAYWYKARLTSGEFGYVQANDLVTDDNLQAAREQGIDSHAQNALPRDEEPWTFVVRGMGLAGYQPNKPQRGIWGGELEISSCLFLGEKAYARRILSLGAAWQIIRGDQIFLGSLIYRIFTETRVEPEARLRAGADTTSGFFVAGVTAGVRYPFAMTYKTHLAGYTEIGLDAPFQGDLPFRLYAAAGIGLHF